eukprot:scaffold7120_cov60-Attheya_sp.AAC.1
MSHRFDQITRLKFIKSSVTTKRHRTRSNVGSEKPLEESYWKGKMLTGQIVDLECRWVSNHFPKRVLDLIEEKVGSFVEIPPGSGTLIKESNQDNLLGNRWTPPIGRHLVWARQETKDWKCLYYATTSVLHYMGDTCGANDKFVQETVAFNTCL